MTLVHEHYATHTHGSTSATLYCTCGASFYWTNPVRVDSNFSAWRVGLAQARAEGKSRMDRHVMEGNRP